MCYTNVNHQNLFFKQYPPNHLLKRALRRKWIFVLFLMTWKKLENQIKWNQIKLQEIRDFWNGVFQKEETGNKQHQKLLKSFLLA